MEEISNISMITVYIVHFASGSIRTEGSFVFFIIRRNASISSGYANISFRQLITAMAGDADEDRGRLSSYNFFSEPSNREFPGTSTKESLAVSPSDFLSVFFFFLLSELPQTNSDKKWKAEVRLHNHGHNGVLYKVLPLMRLILKTGEVHEQRPHHDLRLRRHPRAEEASEGS